MPARRALTALASTATASVVPTIHGRSLYAADRGVGRPLSARFASHVVPTRTELIIGQLERLAHGVLRCFVRRGRVVVELRKGRRRVGRALSVLPDDPSQLVTGARVPEDAFSTEVPEFIGSPWHELEYMSLWTVRGLREKGTAEVIVDL
jgi:hypothetical protein